jgi:hypothetical protein
VNIGHVSIVKGTPSTSPVDPGDDLQERQKAFYNCVKNAVVRANSELQEYIKDFKLIPTILELGGMIIGALVNGGWSFIKAAEAAADIAAAWETGILEGSVMAIIGFLLLKTLVHMIEKGFAVPASIHQRLEKGINDCMVLYNLNLQGEPTIPTLPPRR